jgi:hypothetical protein
VLSHNVGNNFSRCFLDDCGAARSVFIATNDSEPGFALQTAVKTGAKLALLWFKVNRLRRCGSGRGGILFPLALRVGLPPKP